jgi:hypothetical protein
MKRLLLALALTFSLAAVARGQQPAPAGAESETPTPDGAEQAPGAVPDAAPPVAPGMDTAEAQLNSAPPPSGLESSVEPMSADELDALGIDVDHAGEDTDLHFSGFADFSFANTFVPKDSLWRSTGSAPTHSTFFVGNFNLYLRKNLTESIRTMGEIRFSYLPNGSADPVLGTRISTEAADYNDYGRPLRWGGIEIERIYVEWTAHPLITIRGGQFLTPYGIWNVDHGSPTIIPVQRPFVVGLGWFPERQTGVELFGRWDFSGKQGIGYHLTLSNGTGPVSEYADLDENKAVGGRAFWEYRGLGELRVGGSAYYGRDSVTSISYTIAPNGDVGTGETVDSQFDALAIAADVSWKYAGWQLQSEWISYQRAYTEEGRKRQNVLGTYLVPADDVSWGMYFLAGHRFRWLGVMPFAVIEHIDSESSRGTFTNITLQGGLNVRPIDALTLKLVYYHVAFLSGASFSGDPLRLVQAQVAWAF